MGRVYRPWYYNVRRERVTVASWYAEWQTVEGKTRRKKVGKDKRLAVAYLAKVEAEVARVRAGVAAPDASGDATRPLDQMAELYLEELAGRDTSESYRQLVQDYLARILRECKWLLWSDVRPSDLTRFLARRRQEFRNGPATLNSYLRTAKGFCNWLAERIGTTSPLKRLKAYPEEVDRRRSKRILTDTELAALIAAAETSTSSRSRFSGRDRAMLYRVAAYTGIRAGELASLTPSNFHMNRTPPVVEVEARDAKGKRTEPVPIPAMIADVIRDWLAGKPRSGKLWPGNWADNRKQRDWLERDLKRAGIEAADDRGRRVTFHSLKRRYVVRLIEAGAKIHEVRRLARHRDIKTTLEYYTDEQLADLGALADKLR